MVTYLEHICKNKLMLEKLPVEVSG